MSIRQPILANGRKMSSALSVQALDNSISVYDTVGSGGNYQAQARVVWHANGKCVLYDATLAYPEYAVSSYNWLLAGLVGQVDLRITAYTGDAMDSGLAINTRFVLSTQRSLVISVASTGGASKSNTFTYQLLSNSSGSVLASYAGSTLYVNVGAG